MHLLSALKQVLLDIDKAIKIIRETKTNNEVVERLMTVFSIDKEQAEFVAEIKLRHLNKEYLINRIKDIENLKCEIENLDDLLNNRKRLAQYIIDELANVKNYTGSKESQTLSN